MHCSQRALRATESERESFEFCMGTGSFRLQNAGRKALRPSQKKLRTSSCNPVHDTGWRRLSLVISSLVISRVTHGDEDDEEVIGC